MELFNVGGWLSHGDFASDVDADILTVVEYRLFLARERIEGQWYGVCMGACISGLFPCG